MSANRKVNIIEDLDGNKIVFIHDIIFKNKKSIDWDDVEAYLKRFVGEFYTIEASNDIVYIGSDLPDEYAHSNYTNILKGANAKAKANAVQGMPELINIAFNRQFEKNRKEKHMQDAKYGWYSYDSKFAIPVFNQEGLVERYNVFHTALLVRHDKDGKLYLYDIMKIKKETSILFQSKDLTQ